MKERAKTLVELVQGAEFLFTDGARDLDDAAAKIADAGGARHAWPQPCPRWKRPTGRRRPWKPPPAALPKPNGLKLGQVAQPLRAALTGKAASPPLFEMLALLGREESLIRLRAYAA